jgi:hypothetical protein
MFLEMHNPQVIDLQSTRDRVKVRIGENKHELRFALNLSFLTEAEAISFFEIALSKLKGPKPSE